MLCHIYLHFCDQVRACRTTARLVVAFLLIFVPASISWGGQEETNAKRSPATSKSAPGRASLDDLFTTESDTPGGHSPLLPGSSIVPRKTWQYDFDDPDSPGDFPLRYWIRMQDDPEWPTALFPLWNRTAYDPAAPDPTNATPRVFQLQALGGNIGIRLVDGVIPAIPLTDYLIRVDTRTINTRRSRALVIARFLDNHGNAIPGSEQKSPPIITHGSWQEVNIALYGEFPDAAWIQIDLIIAQPNLWRPIKTLPQQVILEDVDAYAQFDNLSVWRLPRVELSASASNVIAPPNQPTIKYHLDDLTAGEHATATLRLHDINGYLRDEMKFDIDQPAFDGTWKPAIQSFGWYRASLIITQGKDIITSVQLDFAFVPAAQGPKNNTTPASAFTTILDTYPAKRTIAALPDLLDLLKADRAAIPLWDRSFTINNIKSARDGIERIIEKAIGYQRSIDLIIDTVPADLILKSATGADGMLETLAGNDEFSEKYLDDFLITFGQRVKRWMIGSPTGNDSFTYLSHPEDILAAIKRRVENLVPNPVIEFPYPGDYEVPDQNSTGKLTTAATTDNNILINNPTTSSAKTAQSTVEHQFLITLPAAVRSEGVSNFVKNTLSRTQHPSFLIEPLDPALFGRYAAAVELAEKTILAVFAGAEEIAIIKPWKEVGPIRPQPQPDHLYPVWRTLHDELTGRRPQGALDLAPGVTAYIFADADLNNGTLALWNDSPEEEAQLIKIYLGPKSVQAVDIFGNRSTLPFDGEKHTIFVGRSPIYLEGIDAGLAVFRAGVHIEPEFIEAATVSDTHQIILSNPWGRTIQGSIRLLSPKDWRFQPRFLTFAIPPNGKITLPVDITVPIYEVAGDQSIEAEIIIRTTRQYGITASFPMSLGSSQIVINPSYDFIPNSSGTNDLIVTLEITNKSNDNADIQVFSIAPVDTGYPFQHADLPTLKPGETVEQSFFYPKGGDQLIGATLRVGFRGLDTTDRLNIKLPIN